MCGLYILTLKSYSIRYCGRILGEHIAQLTILAGTVFGNILIWAASSSQKEKRLFHRLSGHNVIPILFCLVLDILFEKSFWFRVSFSP